MRRSCATHRRTGCLRTKRLTLASRTKTAPRTAVGLTAMDPLLGNIQADSAAPLAKGTPGLQQQVLISWVFIMASTFLVLDFATAQLGSPTNPDGYFSIHPNVSYITGVISCVFWLQGFILLTHWHVYSINDTASLGFMGTLLKLLAAIFFNMQPMSALWDETATASANATNTTALNWGSVSPGNAAEYMFGWSDFLGICLFHSGNLCSIIDMMRNMFKYETPFAFSNLPVWGMWVYLLATTFLVTCNALAYFGSPANGTIPEEYGFFWWFTALCQLTGSSLLLAGSFIYLYWSTATRGSRWACILP